MGKNALIPVSLLLAILFFFASCSTSKTTVSHQKQFKSINHHTDLLRQKVVKEAISYIGTKYKYGGKSPKAFDCSGYTKYVMSQNGIKIPAGSAYQAIGGKRVAPTKARPGDLIFFGKKGNVNHVGIVIENGNKGIMVAHSTSSKGVIIDNMQEASYWRNRMLYCRNVLD